LAALQQQRAVEMADDKEQQEVALVIEKFNEER